MCTRCTPEHQPSSKDITFRCSLLLFFPLTSPSSHLQIIVLGKHPIMIDTQCIATSSTPELFLFEPLLLVVAVLPLHPFHSTSTAGALMEAIGTSVDDGLWLALVQELSVSLFMYYHLCSGDGGIVGNFCGQDSLLAITRAAFLQSSVLCWRIRWISRAASTSRTTHFTRAAPIRSLLLFVAMNS